MAAITDQRSGIKLRPFHLYWLQSEESLEVLLLSFHCNINLCGIHQSDAQIFYHFFYGIGKWILLSTLGWPDRHSSGIKNKVMHFNSVSTCSLMCRSSQSPAFFSYRPVKITGLLKLLSEFDLFVTVFLFRLPENSKNEWFSRLHIFLKSLPNSLNNSWHLLKFLKKFSRPVCSFV